MTEVFGYYIHIDPHLSGGGRFLVWPAVGPRILQQKGHCFTMAVALLSLIIFRDNPQDIFACGILRAVPVVVRDLSLAS